MFEDIGASEVVSIIIILDIGDISIFITITIATVVLIVNVNTGHACVSTLLYL